MPYYVMTCVYSFYVNYKNTKKKFLGDFVHIWRKREKEKEKERKRSRKKKIKKEKKKEEERKKERKRKKEKEREGVLLNVNKNFVFVFKKRVLFRNYVTFLINECQDKMLNMFFHDRWFEIL